MNNLYMSLHYINIDANLAQRKEINKEDADTYIKKLIQDILKDPSRKQYIQQSDRKEVVAIVIDSVKNRIINDEDADLVANRLLNKEVERQKDIDRMSVNIRRGSLIQALVKDDDDYYYIISKVENVEILDINDMFKRSGPPYENKSFKNCLFKLNEDGEIIEIFLSDKNGQIADYWYNLFLELDELTSDETNTYTTFRFLSSKIKKAIEVISPTDYTKYRNLALGYFQTQESFSIEGFFEYTFGSREPDSDGIDISKLKDNIISNMNDKKMDTAFEIVPKALKARMFKETKKVNDYVSITVEGFEPEIQSNIKTKEENGNNYIMIKATDMETFNRYNWIS